MIPEGSVPVMFLPREDVQNAFLPGEHDWNDKAQQGYEEKLGNKKKKKKNPYEKLGPQETWPQSNQDTREPMTASEPQTEEEQSAWDWAKENVNMRVHAAPGRSGGGGGMTTQAAPMQPMQIGGGGQNPYIQQLIAMLSRGGYFRASPRTR